MLETILQDFSELAKIPRPSHHEKKVSDFLKEKLLQLGCDNVVQDENFNLIAEIKASCGCEKIPVTILQAHMDMVCVAKDGVHYEPMKDSIRLIRTGKFLQADGTSLGADDGIGIAQILYIVRQKDFFKHGKLRIIFTVDEESGMSGAQKLDQKFFTDAQFLINCDSENSETLTVGSAGGVALHMEKTIALQKAAGRAKKFLINGLIGGHSGEKIHEGRANALKLLTQIILKLAEKNFLHGVNHVCGGQAKNAIASSASAVLFFKENISDEEIKKFLFDEEKNFQKNFSDIEKIKNPFSCEDIFENEMMPLHEIEPFLNLMNEFPQGVLAWSTLSDNFVETSANLGVLRCEENQLRLVDYVRSSSFEKLQQIFKNFEAKQNDGIKIWAEDWSPSWAVKKNNRLEKIMTKIFPTIRQQELIVEEIHAGLECSFFAEKNPALEMVSLGTDNFDIHSANEHVLLETIEPQTQLLLQTIETIAK